MLGKLAWKLFSFAYASANLLAVLVIAGVRDGAFFKRPSKEAVRELETGALEHLIYDARVANLVTAKKQYWSVGLNPLPGFSHQFFTLRSGIRLHYVCRMGILVWLHADCMPFRL